MECLAVLIAGLSGIVGVALIVERDCRRLLWTARLIMIAKRQS